MLEEKHIYLENWASDWLDSITERGSGHTPNKAKPEYWHGGIKWISLKDSNKLDRIYISETEEEISEEGLKNSSAVLHPPGIVVLSRDAGVGKSAITTQFMAVSQHFITWKCSPKLNNHYLYYWLQLMKPEFERIAAGSTIKTIGLPYFKKLQITYPPSLEEQRKIVEILMDWDRAIDLTAQLIAAKQQRKRGLMQQLLTGKKRFEEFLHAPWPSLKAGDIFQPYSVRNNREEELLSVTQERGVIPRSMLETRVVMPAGETASYKLVEPGNFIISLRSFQGGIEYSEYRGLVSPAYTVLRPKEPMIDHFYKHLFKSQNFISRLGVAIIGIRDGKQINFEDFAAIRLAYPALQEQKRIADVLDTCDQELALLDRKLALLKKQKQGLMQQLLTGRIRVKV